MGALDRKHCVHPSKYMQKNRLFEQKKHTAQSSYSMRKTKPNMPIIPSRQKKSLHAHTSRCREQIKSRQIHISTSACTFETPDAELQHVRVFLCVLILNFSMYLRDARSFLSRSIKKSQQAEPQMYSLCKASNVLVMQNLKWIHQADDNTRNTEEGPTHEGERKDPCGKERGRATQEGERKNPRFNHLGCSHA